MRYVLLRLDQLEILPHLSVELQCFLSGAKQQSTFGQQEHDDVQETPLLKTLLKPRVALFVGRLKIALSSKGLDFVMLFFLLGVDVILVCNIFFFIVIEGVFLTLVDVLAMAGLLTLMRQGKRVGILLFYKLFDDPCEMLLNFTYLVMDLR